MLERINQIEADQEAVLRTGIADIQKTLSNLKEAIYAEYAR